MFLRFHKNKYVRKLIRRIMRLYWFIVTFSTRRNIRLSIRKGDGWNQDYLKSFVHHSLQNFLISHDFLKNLTLKGRTVLQHASSIIDFGCGTGELAHSINGMFPGKRLDGYDVAESAVRFANMRYGKTNIHYHAVSSENILSVLEPADVIVSSQTLEHFRNPFVIVDALLQKGTYVFVVVPYNQTIDESYEREGGAAHAFSFHEHSFDQYEVLDYVIFQTLGWDYSIGAEKPKQIAFLLTKK